MTSTLEYYLTSIFIIRSSSPAYSSAITPQHLHGKSDMNGSFITTLDNTKMNIKDTGGAGITYRVIALGYGPDDGGFESR